ncbi:MAG: hypothetical protein AAF518_20910 [Spirochaetota bacterium]
MKYVLYIAAFTSLLTCAKFEEDSRDVSTTSGLFLSKLISDSIQVPLSGSVTGLTSGTLVLYINGADLSVTAPNDTFTYWINKDTAYSITATTTSEDLSCSIDNPNGNSGRYGNSSIQVTCLEVVASHY